MDPIQSWIDPDEVRKLAENLLRPAHDMNEDMGYDEDFVGFAEDEPAQTSQAASGESRPFARAHLEQAPPKETPAHPVTPPAAAPPQPSTATPQSVSHSLDEARRIAGGSGMLETPHTPPTTPAAAPTEPPIVEETPEPSLSQPPEHPTSPFQISDDQSQESQIPMAKPLLDEAVLETVTDRGPFLKRLTQFSQTARQNFGCNALFLIDDDGQILLDEIGNSKLVEVARTLAKASRRASQQTQGAGAVGNLHVKIGSNTTLEILPAQSRYGLLILGMVVHNPMTSAQAQHVSQLLQQTIEPSS